MTKIISAMVSINEKIVSEGGKEWQPAWMQHAIWDMINEKEQITSVKVEKVRETTTATMNELIGIFVMQENIPEKGFQELTLGGGDEQMSETLDDSIMQSLLSKC